MRMKAGPPSGVLRLRGSVTLLFGVMVSLGK